MASGVKFNQTYLKHNGSINNIKSHLAYRLPALLKFVFLQLVKMFAVVVWIFMVCWAPYHIYFIYSYHNPQITRISYISHVYLAFYWLAMATTCVNPIIYVRISLLRFQILILIK